MRKTDVLKLRFYNSKKLVPWSIFGELQFTKILMSFKTSCSNLKIKGLGAKQCEAFLLVCLWKELWRFKVKESVHFVEKKYTLTKTKRNRPEIPHTVLERQNWCFSSYKNHKLRLKLWWVGVRERKKRAFVVPFILSKGNVF